MYRESILKKYSFQYNFLNVIEYMLTDDIYRVTIYSLNDMSRHDITFSDTKESVNGTIE